MNTSLNDDIHFYDLYSFSGLHKIDQLFLRQLQNYDEELYQNVLKARTFLTHQRTSDNVTSHDYAAINQSALIIDISPLVNQFIAHLFSITSSVAAQISEQQRFILIHNFKRRIIQKRILPKYKNDSWPEFIDLDGYSSLLALFHDLAGMNDYDFINLYETATHNNDVRLAQYERYMAWRFHPCCPIINVKETSLFALTTVINYDNLFPYHRDETTIYSKFIKPRFGFDLIDSGPTVQHAADHAHYCLKCHQNDKDSCSKGLTDNHDIPHVNPLGNLLTGCPLRQKISEMNTVMEQGFMIASLGIITLDNPMVAATGSRICNDCEKSCIFQKQTPVDVPSIETTILLKVLQLPWGFEIYSLLTRWNPFNFTQPLPLPTTSAKVLVVGAGPAGFTLAHYLLRQGHECVLIDGFKIEPLPPSLTGMGTNGQRIDYDPIIDCKRLWEPLSQRVAAGFGGVTEYGITVRWDKNFLTLIRIILMRHPRLTLQGQTRFGGSLTLTTARQLGFNHVALCCGAGKPALPIIPNLLAQGVRAASDFLLTLQASSAAHEKSVTPLQIRMPIIILGGGLTAMDTATEAMAYYPQQVLKFAQRHQQLGDQHGLDDAESSWKTDEELRTAYEFLKHATLLLNEQEQAQRENRQPCYAKLMQSWGGVTVLYRKKLQESPAYRLNAHEVDEALKQGVWFREDSVLEQIITNEDDVLTHVKILGEHQLQPCKTLLVATGTQPNIHYGLEYPEHVTMGNNTFIFDDGIIVDEHKQHLPSPFIENAFSPEFVSAFGDLDPRYMGSVVKAMASAKNGYKFIDRMLRQSCSQTNKELRNKQSSLGQQLIPLLTSRLITVKEINSQFIELVIKSPLSAQAYQPGHFFRLQHYNQHIDQRQLATLSRALAVTPIYVDKIENLLTFILAIHGPGLNFIKACYPGDEIALMGPTGSAVTIPNDKTVLIMAKGFHTISSLPLIEAMLVSQCKVHLYMPDQYDLFLFNLYRQDHLDLMIIHDLNTIEDQLSFYKHIFVKGPTVFTQIMQQWFMDHQNQLHHECQILASINSPMQCMMKGICAQCLQLNRDARGRETIVYSCVTYDQQLKEVDLDTLKNRLEQNCIMEQNNQASHL